MSIELSNLYHINKLNANFTQLNGKERVSFILEHKKGTRAINANISPKDRRRQMF